MKTVGKQVFSVDLFIRLVGAVILILSLALGAPAAQAAAVPAAHYAQAGSSMSALGLAVSDHLNPDGSLNLKQAFSGALNLTGWQVKLDARRGPIFTRETEKKRAAALVSPWSAFPNGGLNGIVDCLAAVGADVFAGGTFFMSTDGANILSRVAVLNGASWVNQPNGEGFDAEVLTMAVIGNDVYAGGVFGAHTQGTDYVEHIAVFDGDTGLWSALPGMGVNGEVWALAVHGTDLYVGGLFSRTFDGTIVWNLNGVAKFDTVAQTWSALPDMGLSPTLVYAMAIQGDNLFVGGKFTQTSDGVVKGLNNIARYNLTTNTWYALPNAGLNDRVNALAATPSMLYVGGDFTDVHGSVSNELFHITGYDGSWRPLPYGGLQGTVNSLFVDGSNIYAGGTFTRTGDTFEQITLNYIGVYDGSTWHALPNNGLNNPVNAIFVLGNTLYAGGHFSATADNAVTGLGHIARLALTSPPPPPGSFNKGLPVIDATGLSIPLQLTWGSSSGATGYSYCYTTHSGGACDTGWHDAGTSLSAPLPDLRHNTTYYWQVTANNSAGSTDSNGGAWWSFSTTQGVTLFIPLANK